MKDLLSKKDLNLNSRNKSFNSILVPDGNIAASDYPQLLTSRLSAPPLLVRLRPPLPLRLALVPFPSSGFRPSIR